VSRDIGEIEAVITSEGEKRREGDFELPRQILWQVVTRTAWKRVRGYENRWEGSEIRKRRCEHVSLLSTMEIFLVSSEDKTADYSS
jgi:hypothetical protein